jgi:hypothetical protein
MSAGRRVQLGVVAAFGLLACGEDPEAGAETFAATGETGESGEPGEPGAEGQDPNDSDDTSDDPGEQQPGPKGMFIAVGDGGRRASSSDGLSWTELIGTGAIDTQAEDGEHDILRAVAVGQGVAIAVGGGGLDWNGNSMIMRSTDGLSWDEDLIAGVDGLDRRKLSAVGFVNGVFIAAGHQSHILRSADGGLSWTRVYPEHHSSTTVFGVAGHDQIFVLVGVHQDAWDQPKVSYVHRSSDAGQSFGAPSYFGQDGDQLTSVASNGERFVAVGPQQCLRSPDGVDWAACGLLGSSYKAVSFTNGRFVVTYADGVSTSSDGENWSAHVESPAGVPGEVVFGNGVYAGVRYYDRGVSEALGDWAFVTHGGFPLRDLVFLPLE